MIFVGSGSLLSKAVEFAYQSECMIDAVCCKKGDLAIERLKKYEIFCTEIDNPNEQLGELLPYCDDGIIFSINNSFILSDDLLSQDKTFFNIHGGLIQEYRGLAEICIMSCIAQGSAEYGVTLHELLPGKPVDSGPVIDQLRFCLENENFESLMNKSLTACQEIFEKNLKSILSNSINLYDVPISPNIYKYSELKNILKKSSKAQYEKAIHMGGYEVYFPKLKAFVDSLDLS